MAIKNKNFKYVNYKWSDEFAQKIDPVERLVYRSNILGDDQRITNTGGGNTSSKIMMKDPLTGKDVEVLWVKGSGGVNRAASIKITTMACLRNFLMTSGVRIPILDKK